LSVIYLTPILLVAAAYATLDSTAWMRFAGNGLGPDTGLGAVFHHPWFSLFYIATFSSGSYSLSLIASTFFVAGIVLAFVARCLWRGGNWQDRLLALTLLVLFFAPVILFPKQNNYMAFARSAGFILLLVAQTPLAMRARRQHVVSLVFLAIVFANVPFVVLEALREGQSKASYEIAAREAMRFAGAAADLHTGKILLVPDQFYFLYKPYFSRIAGNYASPLLRPEDIVGYLSCDVWRPDPDQSFWPKDVKLFSRAGSQYVPHLFGIPISRHNWGWSCDTYLAR
jgi:hypothetical protein